MNCTSSRARNLLRYLFKRLPCAGSGQRKRVANPHTFATGLISRAETIDADNGRIETRTTAVIHDIEWLRKRHDWPGLNAIAIVESTRVSGGKIERETRYYVTSLVMLARPLRPVIRSHWAIENSLHWVMDMVFRDDECRVRTNHAPANFTTNRPVAKVCGFATLFR